MNTLEFEKFIKKFESFDSEDGLTKEDIKEINKFKSLLKNSNLQRRIYYLEQLKVIEDAFQEAIDVFIYDSSDKLKYKQAQLDLIGLVIQIIEENKKIFIVHGRDVPARDKLEAFLGKLKIEFVVLENETNGGRTVIEKFLKATDECKYAIILMTPDDIGGLSGNANMKSRARQNVILELGFFLGKLGRDRLLVLHTDGTDIEKPSDFDGIAYLAYDSKGAWKHNVMKELKEAKFFIAEESRSKV